MKDSGGNVIVTGAYYHLSRLISRTAGGTTTHCLYDGWNRIEEFSGTTLQKTYTWGMDLNGTMQGAGGGGGLLAVNSGNAAHYPTYDGNGNVSEYLDSAGAVAAHFEYDPFGNTVVDTDTTGQFAYRFSTKPLDTSTGLYYYGYRWYDPLTGRWPSRDPIGESGGVNLYGFVGNEAVNIIPLPPSLPLLPDSEKIPALDPIPYPDDAGGGEVCFECTCKGTITLRRNEEEADAYLRRVQTSRAPNVEKEKMMKALAASALVGPSFDGAGYGVSNSEAAALIHALNNLRADFRAGSDILTRYFWKHEILILAAVIV